MCIDSSSAAADIISSKLSTSTVDAGVTAQIIPLSSNIPGIICPSPEYTRVYSVLGQIIPPGYEVGKPRIYPVYSVLGQIIPLHKVASPEYTHFLYYVMCKSVGHLVSSMYIRVSQKYEILKSTLLTPLKVTF